jgi:isoquinoline 1-oxidoreductase alpha subunit
MVRVTINGKPHNLEVDPNTPLLWVLREELGLTGAKYGCGAALCGCCTVHVNDEARRSCVTPLASVEGASIVTIEGMTSADNKLHPVQEAWIALDVAQCGYCQTGQIMQATALLAASSNPTDQQIDDAMSGNLCRCGTYNQIRQAIKQAAATMAGNRG